MSLETRQTAEYLGDDQWEWTVCLEGDTADLDQVDRVIYHLHPTFREPVRECSNRQDNFRIRARGWGTFQIRIEVVRKDGTTTPLTHELMLRYPDADGENAPRRGLPAKKKGQPEQHTPKVFISHSAADDDAVESLRDELRQQGVIVLGQENLEAGRPIGEQIRRQFEESDAVVAVVSEGRPSRVVASDLEEAAREGKQLFVVDREGRLDTSFFSDLSSHYVLPGKDSKKLAGQIKTRVTVGKVQW